MPFSQSGQLSAIVGFVESLKPASVLDVGTGMGQYGFLLRTNLENVNLFEFAGTSGKKRPKSEWQVVIDGIEGCAEYLTPVHEYAYNRIMIGEALEQLATLHSGSYELVLAIDILEHLEKPAGHQFLRECRRVASKAALISTPKLFVEQVVEANPFENHRSLWNEQDLIAGGGRGLHH